MADGSFQLKVFSGRGLEFESPATQVNLKSAVGEIGFLPGHREYVGLLSTGIAECVTDTGNTVRFVAAGGVCTYKDEVLTLLADTVDLKESADVSVLKQDEGLLTTELEALSLFDPEWEVVSQKLARIDAVRTLIAE
jgi:F0F1-type ATP synthase epsilon subunit